MHLNSITIYSTALNSIHANTLPLPPLLIHNEISILLCTFKVYNGSMKTAKLCSIEAIHSALFACFYTISHLPIYPILLIFGSVLCNVESCINVLMERLNILSAGARFSLTDGSITHDKVRFTLLNRIVKHDFFYTYEIVGFLNIHKLTAVNELIIVQSDA